MNRLLKLGVIALATTMVTSSYAAPTVGAQPTQAPATQQPAAQPAMQPTPGTINVRPPVPAPQGPQVDKTQVEKIVHDYLISNPEVIVQAMQVLQQKQYAEAQQTVKDTQKIASQYSNDLFRKLNDPVVGNPNATISIVEFYDFQCPHCLDMAPVIEGILKNNKNVRVIFKDFPIRGPMSEVAARAALAAHKQGKYYVLSHALLTSNKPLTEELIFSLAKSHGINVAQLKKDMNDPSIEKQLKDDMELAQNLKLFGTPAFFIMKNNGTMDGTIDYIPGQMNQAQLQDKIDKLK